MKRIGVKARIAVLFCLLVFTTLAAAQTTPSAGSINPACVDPTNAFYGVFNCISGQYYTASQGWYAKLSGYAQNLFALLAVIEFSWAGIQYLLSRDGVESMLASFTKKLMTIGFFYTLLLKGPGWIYDVIQSFQQAGENASGLGHAVDPTSIVAVGLNCAFSIYSGLDNLGIGSRITYGLPVAFCALFIVIAFVIVAGQLLVTLIESYIVTGAGVLFLGFGASRFTSDFTKKYLSYAVSVGVKLLFITLIAGAGMQFSQTWAQMLANSQTGLLHNSFIVTAGALIFAIVAWQVPSFAQALMSGSASLSAGSVMATGAAVVGAATGAALGTAAAARAGIDVTRAAAEAQQAGVGLAKAGGASGSGAHLQGLGHAARAMAAEGGRALGSAVGATRQSTFAKDAQGGSVSRLGDRAASRLQAQTEKATGSGGNGVGGGTPGQPPSPNTPSDGAPLAGGATSAGASGTSSGGGAPASPDAAANTAAGDAAATNMGTPVAGSGETAAMSTSSGPAGANVTAGQAAPGGVPNVQQGGPGAASGTADSSSAPSSPSGGAGKNSSSTSSSGTASTVSIMLPTKGAAPGANSVADAIRSVPPPRIPSDLEPGIGSVEIMLNHGSEED